MKTLDDVLYGSNGIRERIDNYVRGENKRFQDPPLDEPHTLQVKFRLHDETQWEKWPNEVVEPGFQGQAVAQHIGEIIEEFAGTSPHGELNVRFYPEGGSGMAPVRMNQSLQRPSLSADPNMDTVQRQNADYRGEIRELRTLNVTVTTALATLVANQATSIATLSTARTSGSVMAEGGGGFVGLLTMLIGYPMVVSMLGMKKDSSIQEVGAGLAAFTSGLLKQMNGNNQATNKPPQKNDIPPALPPGVLTTDTPDAADVIDVVEHGQEQQIDGEASYADGIPDEHLVAALRVLAATTSGETDAGALIPQALRVAQQAGIEITPAMMKAVQKEETPAVPAPA